MFTLVWGVKALIGKLGRKDKARLENGLGVWSPEMKPHWSRLRDTWGLDGHSLINIGTEWYRLDAQRAFKVSADSILWALLVGAFLL